MDEHIAYLRNEMETAKRKLDTAQSDYNRAKSLVDNAQKLCKHDWSETKYDPIRTPGGSDPGDPPDTMGVDRRFPTSWGPTETPRWSRTCNKCGLHTCTTETVAVAHPKW